MTNFTYFLCLILFFVIGFDGGQTQRFIMEIFDQQTGILQANVSSRYPVFSVGGLDPGKLLKINIFAVNTRGKSETVTMEAFTLKAAEKQTGKVYKHTLYEYETCLFVTQLSCHAKFSIIIIIKMSTTENGFYMRAS